MLLILSPTTKSQFYNILNLFHADPEMQSARRGTLTKGEGLVQLDSLY